MLPGPLLTPVGREVMSLVTPEVDEGWVRQIGSTLRQKVHNVSNVELGQLVSTDEEGRVTLKPLAELIPG